MNLNVNYNEKKLIFEISCDYYSINMEDFIIPTFGIASNILPNHMMIINRPIVIRSTSLNNSIQYTYDYINFGKPSNFRYKFISYIAIPTVWFYDYYGGGLFNQYFNNRFNYDLLKPDSIDPNWGFIRGVDLANGGAIFYEYKRAFPYISISDNDLCINGTTMKYFAGLPTNIGGDNRIVGSFDKGDFRSDNWVEGHKVKVSNASGELVDTNNLYNVSISIDYYNNLYQYVLCARPWFAFTFYKQLGGANEHVILITFVGVERF